VIIFVKTMPPVVDVVSESKRGNKLIADSLNIGDLKLLEHMNRLQEQKGIALKDMVIGKNKNGNYTLHYRER